MAVIKAAARYRWSALGLVFLAQMSNNLATQVVAPLAPLIQPDLGISKTEIGIFSSGAFAGTWCVLLIAGSLADRFGPRRIMMLGQLVAGGFLLLMAAAGSLFQAVAVMFFVGLGRGTVNPAATKAVMDWFPSTLRATAMGIKQGGYPVAGIVTASVLPAVALLAGWRAAMGLTGLAVIAFGLATGALYREAPKAESIRTVEPGVRAGMGEVLRNRYLWVMSVVLVFLLTIQLAVVTYLALYLSEVALVPSVPDARTRVLMAGAFLALCQTGGAIGRVFWGMVSDRVFHGRRMLVLAIIGGLVVLLLLLVAFLEPGQPPGLLAALLFALGVTAVGFNGLTDALAVESVGSKHAATAVGFSMTLGQIGIIAGPPIFGFIVDVCESYQPAWLFLAMLAAAGTLVAIANARGERQIA